METICLIIVGVWLIIKFLGGPSTTNNKNNNSGLSDIEKYKTFEKFNKK